MEDHVGGDWFSMKVEEPITMLEHEAGTRTMGKNDEAQEWEMTE
jgi:hypothetical protein